MDASKPRVMLDANVLIAGILWPRWPNAILQHAVRRDLQLVLPQLVIDSVIAHIRAIDAHQLARFERFLADCAVELIEDPARDEVKQNLDLVRDETDVPVALAAIRAQVDYFVTYDRDFTDLDISTTRIRAAISEILLPPVFLRDVMGWTSDELEAIRYRDWPDFDE